MLRERLDHGFTDGQWQDAKAEAVTVLRQRAARRSNQTISYTELVEHIKAIKLSPHDTRLAHMLGEISSEEDAAGRGMLTVLEAHKEDVRPGDGFFELEDCGTDRSLPMRIAEKDAEGHLRKLPNIENMARAAPWPRTSISTAWSWPRPGRTRPS